MNLLHYFPATKSTMYVLGSLFSDDLQWVDRQKPVFAAFVSGDLPIASAARCLATALFR